MAQGFIDEANKLRDIKPNLLDFFTKKKQEIQSRLDRLVDYDKRCLQELSEGDPSGDRVIPKVEPFCVNVILHHTARVESAERTRDDQPNPISIVLGAGSTGDVQDRIEELFEHVLRRSDCRPIDVDSQALFKQIIGISIEDRSKGSNSEAFQPAAEFLRDFIGSQDRVLPAAYNSLDLGRKGSFEQQKGGAGASQGSSLDCQEEEPRWQPEITSGIQLPDPGKVSSGERLQ